MGDDSLTIGGLVKADKLYEWFERELFSTKKWDDFCKEYGFHPYVPNEGRSEQGKIQQEEQT